MDLILTRKQFRADGIFSELREDSGNLIAVTLEHAYPDGECTPPWVPKIPNGNFTCVRGPHRLAGMDQDFTTFEITGVEGHTNLLFHKGNFNFDSEGCILLGSRIVLGLTRQWIINSKITFNSFIQLQDGLDRFTLTVK